MSEIPRAIIFANGVIENGNWIKPYLKAGDFLIAVDGGYRHMKNAGVTPHLLVGDLDTVNTQDVKNLELSGVEIQKYPPEKDETDLEIALMTALQRGFTVIRILGAFGGRMDHWLANLFILLNPAFNHCDIRFENCTEKAFLIRVDGNIDGKPGDIVSLIPMGNTVRGVRTEGLKYPLRSETLYAHQSRGVSNELIAEKARITIDDGLLLCIHLCKTVKE